MTMELTKAEKAFFDSLPEYGWQYFDWRFQDPILDSLLEKNIVEVQYWPGILWIRRVNHGPYEDDRITRCDLCGKKVWFTDSYSPGDSATCAECDTEVTGRQHPPSLNPDIDPEPCHE